jgi:hypothetical protein
MAEPGGIATSEGAMKYFPILACTLLCAIGTGAEAQKIGTYYGTSADGQFLDFTVGQDTNTNSIAVLEAGINFDAACNGGNPDLIQSWGLGFTQDIANRKADFVFDKYGVLERRQHGHGNDRYTRRRLRAVDRCADKIRVLPVGQAGFFGDLFQRRGESGAARAGHDGPLSARCEVTRHHFGR